MDYQVKILITFALMNLQPHSIIHLNETESTNSFMMKLIGDSKTQPYTIVTTDKQTAGKGQNNRVWHSQPKKNLTFSILLKNKNLNPEKLYVINKTVAFSVVDFLKQEFNIDAQIKWPNDIFVNMKKISGILIENSIAGNQINCIAGIGLNINQSSFPHMSPQAVSVKNITGNSYPLMQCLNQLTNIIIKNVESLMEGKLSNDFSEIYTQKLMFLGQERQYKCNDKIITGRITGVNETGQLIFNESISNSTLFFDHGQFDYNLEEI